MTPCHPAAVSIGVRPTFQTGRGELIEAYILDFDGDLYGRELRLDFLARLRGERRFETRGGADRADAQRRGSARGRSPGTIDESVEHSLGRLRNRGPSATVPAYGRDNN